jgi:DNA-binding NtrC family response regulator
MNILVVDDIKQHREMLAEPFRANHVVRCMADLEEVEQALQDWWPDVALVDAMFPKKKYGQPVFAFESFLELLEDRLHAGLEMPQVILVSGQNETARRFEDVRQWLTFGRVADVIPKSTADVGVDFFRAVVRLRVESLLERQRWRGVEKSAQSDAEWFSRLGIITNSPKVLKLKTDLIAAARSPYCVLLSGSTGCGKELFAKAIHHLAKPGKKFKPLNCSAIPAELFETEIFGVQRIGKDHQVYTEKTGLFEAAGDGTVFLDDIQTLRSEHQPKLLRVVQERGFLKVGATDETPFVGKLVAATNKDLFEEVGKGSFREDLYYRISVFKIQIPDLADRLEDIPILAEHFLSEFVRDRAARYLRCPDIHLHPKSKSMLMSASWDGNVRELKGVIEKTAEYALLECKESESSVVISPELLVKHNPLLQSLAPQISTEDRLLATSDIGVQQWSELDETNAPEIAKTVVKLLSDTGKAEFEKMRMALRPRARGAGDDAPGRDSQDPSAIHCLKALLYLLLRTDNRVNLQDLRLVLGLKWTQAKKVMNVLAALEPSTPRYDAFVTLPLQGGRKEAQIVREMMRPKDLLELS